MASQYGTCFDEHKKAHMTYIIVYVPMNSLQFLCIGTQKISCDLRYSFEFIIIFVYHWYKKSHATYVIVYVSVNPLPFLCTGGTQKSHATYVIVYAPMNSF